MIRPQSKILSLLFAGATVVPLVMVLMTFDTSMNEHSIARSREIERAFVSAALLTDKFHATHSRLPTLNEFRIAVAPSVDSALQILLPPFSAHLTAEVGPPPPGGYVLEYWRGEWSERYISCTRQSTMTFDASNYYLFHNRWGQAVAMSFLALLFVGASVWTWPDKKRLVSLLRPKP